MASKLFHGNKKDVHEVTEPSKNNLFYAAIDFGTTYTGFAFSSKDDLTHIHTSYWSSDKQTAATPKAPTAVLLNKDKEFRAFGYDAEEKYLELLEKGESQNWSYFEKFKMQLYETKNLSRNTQIKDQTGKEHNALEIFTVAIKYIKDRTEEDMKKSIACFDSEDIFWVLTVPAILSDSAKQFMREAAESAGIKGNNLKLILEPEAASSLISTVKTSKVVKLNGESAFEPFPVGTKYIVADLGGGTADLAVHEILEDRKLREISRSDGDAHGGAAVNKKFEGFLETLFGQKVVTKLRLTQPEEYTLLMQAFETKKRKLKNENSDGFRFDMPVVELKEIIGETYETLRQEINDRFKGKVELGKRKLFLDAEIMVSFFEESTNGIISFISKLRQAESQTVGLINIIVLVGGLSQSPYVQQRILASIPGIKLIVPTDPSLAVLKGAVILGQNPLSISERIARYSYGFSNAQLFDATIHPESLKISRNGVELCHSIFCKVIEKGQVLKVGQKFSTHAEHKCSNVAEMFMPILDRIYRSNDTNPKYTTEEDGSTCIGTVIGFPPSLGWPPISVIEQSLVVGESEFSIVITDLLADHVIQSKLDFLSEEEEIHIVSEHPCKIQ